MTGKNKLPYYKRYPRDFLEGTLGMPFELKAAYGLILDLIYIHGTELPDDQRFIAGQLNVSVRKWNSIRSELIKIDKIQIISGFISNYRAVIELESLSKYQEKQAENATKSNNNRYLQKPPHKPKCYQPEPEPEPKKRDTKVSTKKSDPIFISLSQWASDEACHSFIAYRKKHKARALTERAGKMLATDLGKIFNAGHDPTDALGLAELRGWAAVNLEWYENAKGKGKNNGKRHNDNDDLLHIIATAARAR